MNHPDFVAPDATVKQTRDVIAAHLVPVARPKLSSGRKSQTKPMKDINVVNLEEVVRNYRWQEIQRQYLPLLSRQREETATPMYIAGVRP